MLHMKRSFLLATAACGLIGMLPPEMASAKVIELGATASPLVAPICPASVKPQNCTIVLTQVTALETIRDGITYPTTVSRSGKIVAFTVGLSRLDSNRARAKADIHFLDTTYGGVPQVAITVLRRRGKASQRSWTVTAEQSPPQHVIPYLGQVVQFPLAKALSVSPGDAIALSVPTWAPVLSFGLTGTRFAYRQSRTTNCGTPAGTEEAQLTIGANTRYICNYPGTRAEYSATEVTEPVPTKNYVHAPLVRRRKVRTWGAGR
jgi:hypothetical protein